MLQHLQIQRWQREWHYVTYHHSLFCCVTKQSGSFALALYSFFFFFLTKHTGNIRFHFISWEISVEYTKKWISIFFLHLFVKLEVWNLERDRSKASKKGVWN